MRRRIILFALALVLTASSSHAGFLDKAQDLFRSETSLTRQEMSKIDVSVKERHMFDAGNSRYVTVYNGTDYTLSEITLISSSGRSYRVGFPDYSFTKLGPNTTKETSFTAFTDDLFGNFRLDEAKGYK